MPTCCKGSTGVAAASERLMKPVSPTPVYTATQSSNGAISFSNITPDLLIKSDSSFIMLLYIRSCSNIWDDLLMQLVLLVQPDSYRDGNFLLLLSRDIFL